MAKSVDNKTKYAVIVGGINVDIGGRSFETLVGEDSNPGVVSTSLGGVGRNIAHNLSLMGADVKLLSAYGNDIYGDKVAASCAELGIDISRALRVDGAVTSTYLYIAAPDGDMALAVSDMAVCDYITPEYLAANIEILNNAAVVTVDTNVPQESIEYLAANCTAPVFCDPVSTKKAVKLENALGKIHTLKPNRIEAELLSGVSINSREDAENAAKVMLEKGLKRVFISMGADGVYAAERGNGIWLGNLLGNMVNTTGCGDAFMAAIMYAYLEDMRLEETARAGLAAASIAMESETTINPAMSADNLKKRMIAK